MALSRAKCAFLMQVPSRIFQGVQQECWPLDGTCWTALVLGLFGGLPDTANIQDPTCTACIPECHKSQHVCGITLMSCMAGHSRALCSLYVPQRTPEAFYGCVAAHRMLGCMQWYGMHSGVLQVVTCLWNHLGVLHGRALNGASSWLFVHATKDSKSIP